MWCLILIVTLLRGPLGTSRSRGAVFELSSRFGASVPSILIQRRFNKAGRICKMLDDREQMTEKEQNFPCGDGLC